MLPWKSLIPLERQSSRAVYLQIAEGIIHTIQCGHIRAGERLPGSRKMAQLLDINRKTALLAYDELLAQGWIVSHASRGTFVANDLPILRSRAWVESASDGPDEGSLTWQIPAYLRQPVTFEYVLAFDDGLPDIRLAPIEELARAYSRNLRSLWDRRRLSYGDALGYYRLREILAKELNATRGLDIGPEHLMITRGSQMAVFLAGRVAIPPNGGRVAMTDPGYRTAALNFRYAGGRIVPVSVDEEGMVVSELEQLCREQTISLVYVTPHHHYPTTVMMSAQRRMQLLNLAAKYHFTILEDDYDYDFHYANSPVLPLASADRQKRVLYIGSFSKNISPAIRMGYLVGDPALIRELPKIRRLIDRQGDMVMEAAIADLIEGGIIRRYLKKALKQYRLRRDHCCTALRRQLGDCLRFEEPAGGLAIWGRFHPEIDLVRLSESMAEENVYLSNGKFYAPEQNAIRMGFAGMSKTEMDLAISILERRIRSAFPTFAAAN